MNKWNFNGLWRCCTLTNFTYNAHWWICSIDLAHVIIIAVLISVLYEIITKHLNFVSGRLKLVLPFIFINERFNSIAKLIQSSLVLITLNMFHLAVINRWNRSLRMYDSRPQWTVCPFTDYSRFDLAVSIFDGSIGLPDPSSVLFPAWINIDLTNPIITEWV